MNAINEEIEELQKKSLEILLVFQKFCDQHQLLFYFCGGCCIGTVRHKGFIPWDDDVDVFMPRQDYEKLRKIWPEEMKGTQYTLLFNDENHYIRSQIIKICDENTTFISERRKDLDMPQGICLEILPLDGCPKSRIRRKMQLLWGMIYQIFILQEPITSSKKIFQTVSSFLLKLFPKWETRCKIWRYAEKKMTQYPIEKCEKVTELCTWFRYMVNEYDKTWFEKAVYGEFEGYKMPIPCGYDSYLRMAFGDYMQLPPKDKQKPIHVEFVDVHKSYLAYRGTRYALDCKKKEEKNS